MALMAERIFLIIAIVFSIVVPIRDGRAGPYELKARLDARSGGGEADVRLS